ncbi:ABC transporter ATP-binding protein [Desulfurivibrio alkaliphilus]|nr:ABC transporter ATP-binding protein [Desulfurivibrio alkaliphilus]
MNGFQLHNVFFAYDDTTVLEEINLELPPGRFYGIVGPNGCGKTTLLDLLTGTRRVRRGSVLFQGRAIGAYRRRTLARQLALVPQEYAIDFAFTVEEVILMGRHPHLPRFGRPTAADWEIIDRVMAEIGIDYLAGRPVNELSGGEKQRVAVARALAQQTPTLLLDEATASLDIRYTLNILGALRQRVSRGEQTVIAVLHDLNLAAAFCDHLVFLNRGRIQAAGPTDQVLTPANIARVFGVECAVSHDRFSNAPRVSFNLVSHKQPPAAAEAWQ